MFSNYFCKLYGKLHKMDHNKYLPPKYSYSVKDLAEYFGVFRDFSPTPDKSRFLNEDSEDNPSSLPKKKAGS